MLSRIGITQLITVSIIICWCWGLNFKIFTSQHLNVRVQLLSYLKGEQIVVVNIAKLLAHTCLRVEQKYKTNKLKTQEDVIK